MRAIEIAAEFEAGLQQLIDSEMAPIRQEVADGDIDFALRLIIDMLTKIGAAPALKPAPRLRRPATTGSLEVDTLILAGIRWALRCSATASTPWPPPAALPHPWFAYGHRSMTAGWKALSIRETPAELSAANIFIRERSLASF